MIERFVLYGLIGMGMEVLWTGIFSLLKKNYYLTANTSFWMFFICGSAVFFEPVCKNLLFLPIMVRGGIYMVFIYGMEYATGKVLKFFNTCPWDYSHNKFNIEGIICLNYAPVWFAVGIIYETVYLFVS